MPLEIVNVHIREGVFTNTVGSAPTVTNLAATAEIRGVTFRWDAKAMGAFYWEVKWNINSEGLLAAWRRVDNNEIRLSTGNTRVHTANVLIQVRSNDGDTQSSTVSVNTNALAGDFDDNDIDTAITGTKLSGVTSANITNGTIVAADINTGTITATQMAANSIDSDQYVDGSIDLIHMSDNSVTTRHYVDGSIESAHLDNDSVGADELAANAVVNASIVNTTIEPGKLHADTTNRMFDSGGRTKLDTALPVAINLLASDDKILIGDGTNKNLDETAIRNQVKIDLQLNNVENKTAADQLTAGLAAGSLTKAWLLSNIGEVVMRDTLVANINAATDLATKSDIKVKATKVEADAVSTPLFDAAGHVLIGVTTDSATANIRTAADIIASMDIDGNSMLWDPTSWKAGTTTATIPGSKIHTTAQFVTANEKTGAGRAYTGLDSSNRLTTSVYDGSSAVTAAQIVQRASGRRVVWAESAVSGTPAFTVRTVAAAASKTQFQCVQYMKCSGDSKLYITGIGYMGGSTTDGILTIELRTSAGTIIGGGLTGTVTFGSGAVLTKYEAELTVTAADPDGTLYQVWLGLTGGASHNTNWKGGVLSVDQV